jgi:ankyrin repeat protein
MSALLADNIRCARWRRLSSLRSFSVPAPTPQAGKPAPRKLLVSVLLLFVSLAPTLAADRRETTNATTILEAAAKGNSAAIRSLAATDPAQVNAVGPKGQTPLHLAVSFGHPETVKQLLSQGANPEVRNARGATPLHEAAGQGRTLAVRALLDGGADPQALDSEGCTPLAWSFRAFRAPTTETLRGRTKEPDLFATSGIGDRARMKALLRGNPALIEKRDRDGRTPLHYAVLGRQDRMVRLLIARGADIYAPNAHGFTPLRLAEMMDDSNIAKILRREMVRRQLRIWTVAAGFASIVGIAQIIAARHKKGKTRAKGKDAEAAEPR